MKIKKQIGILLFGMMLLSAYFCVKGIEVNRIASTSLYQHRFAEDFGNMSIESVMVDSKAVAGRKNIFFLNSWDKDKWIYELDEKDYEALLRIVEAEAGGEDEEGKMLVAAVVLNRVENKHFPDTVEDVILQHENGTYQFSPVGNGRFYKVNVSDETIEAVEKVLEGENDSKGALYFVAEKYANKDKLSWFRENLTFLMTHGGHSFFS